MSGWAPGSAYRTSCGGWGLLPLISRSGFLNHSAFHISDHMAGVKSVLYAHCTVFSSNPGLCPLDPSSVPQVGTIKMSPNSARFLQGEERVQNYSKPLLWTHPFLRPEGSSVRKKRNGYLNSLQGLSSCARCLHMSSQYCYQHSRTRIIILI